MKKILPFLVLGILVISGLGAVNVSGESAKYDKANIVFTKPKITEQDEYVKITIDEANSYLMRSNQPLLPSYTHCFQFPFGTKIKNVICKVKNTQEIALYKEIIPSPEPVIVGRISKSISDESISSVIYPERWYDYSVHTGLNGAIGTVYVYVDTYPVRYHFQDKKIEWIDEVDIKVEFEQTETKITSADKYELVIITEDEFVSTLNPLNQHKNNRGISTKTVSLSDIYSGTYFTNQGRDKAEQIKYFIKNAIKSWSTTNILLVGYDLPRRETHVLVNDDDSEIFTSDLYYADIYDGEGNFSSWDSNNNDVFCEYNWGSQENFDELDLHPDVHLARIPCVDSDELTTIIDKITNYENSKAYSQSWFTDLIAIGGDSFPGDKKEILEGEYVNQEVIDIMNSIGFNSETLWDTEDDLTLKIKVLSALKNGAGFIDFSGHGNENTWATHPHENENIWLPPPFGIKSKDITDIRNGDKLPIVVVGACSVAKFADEKNTFNYAWLKDSNGGGVATFGATGLGWAYTGEGVTQGLIERIAISVFEAFKEGAITVGELWTNSINSYFIHPGLKEDVDYKTVLEWQCFGDPTLAIAEDSEPPATPSKPTGQASGEVGESYEYSTSTTDPEGDKVYYLFDWGDGTDSGWVGPFSSGQTAKASNLWDEEGDFQIKVKAKDVHGKTSDWSEPLSISMPRIRVKQFPILEMMWEKISIFFHFFIQ